MDLRGPGTLGQPRASALGAGLERHGALHERPDVRLHRVEVLGQHRLGDLGHQALVGHVDVVHLHLAGLAVEELLALPGGEPGDRDVGRHHRGEDADVPAVTGVAGNGDRTLVEGLGLVEQLGQVDVGDRAHALAPRAHAAGDRVGALLRRRGRALVDLDLADPAGGRDVERVRLRRADVRLPEPAEQDAQQGVSVRDRAHRGPGVRAHPLLVDEDRRGQPIEHVHVGPRQARHEALEEGAVRLVDHPLRLRGDRVEDQRALARAGDTGEHRQPALGDLDIHVLEVVLPRAVHADQLVAVRGVPRRWFQVRAGGRTHGVSSDGAGRPSRGRRRGTPRRRRLA